MPFLWITEFKSYGKDPSGYRSPSPLEPPVAKQYLQFSGTLRPTSAPFNEETTFVRLCADSDFNGLFGAPGENPIASVEDERFRMDVEYFRAVKPGMKLSIWK